MYNVYAAQKKRREAAEHAARTAPRSTDPRHKLRRDQLAENYLARVTQWIRLESLKQPESPRQPSPPPLSHYTFRERNPDQEIGPATLSASRYTAEKDRVAAAEKEAKTLFLGEPYAAAKTVFRPREPEAEISTPRITVAKHTSDADRIQQALQANAPFRDFGNPRLREPYKDRRDEPLRLERKDKWVAQRPFVGMVHPSQYKPPSSIMTTSPYKEPYKVELESHHRPASATPAQSPRALRTAIKAPMAATSTSTVAVTEETVKYLPKRFLRSSAVGQAITADLHTAREEPARKRDRQSYYMAATMLAHKPARRSLKIDTSTDNQLHREWEEHMEETAGELARSLLTQRQRVGSGRQPRQPQQPRQSGQLQSPRRQQTLA